MMAVTRLTGGLSPADGSDPRTFPLIFNEAADVIDANETDITALEALNPVAFGTAVASVGDVLVFDGDEFVPHVPSDNLVINGAMQVHQRGTSVSVPPNTISFLADRWRFGGFGTWTQSVENDGPTGSGFTKSLKLLCTTAQASPAAAGSLIFSQLFEGQNLQGTRKGTADAEQLTISFFVQSNVTGTYVVELRDADNSRFVSAAYSVDVSGVWEKKTITFPADTTGAFDNDNGRSLDLNFWLGAGSDFSSGTLSTVWHTTNANRAAGVTNLAAATNNYWQVTGVQLETGAVATPFQFEDFGTTLAKCQRYFHNPGAVSGSYVIFNSGNFKSDSFYFPATMRAAPSIAVFDAAGNANKISIQNAGGNDQGNITPPSSLNITASSWFYAAGGITATTGTNGHLRLLKYFADAEL